MLEIYSDAATLKHALAFEAALAQAKAEAGLIGTGEADAIADLCATIRIDAAGLADEAALAGTLAIPLVRRLTEAVKEHPAVAQALHRGATSQDLADTIMMLQARDALRLLQADLDRTCRALAVIAERYAAQPALGRTLLRDAWQISFGLRVAQWMSGIESARRRLARAARDALLLQFGGAVGTRAGLNGKGADVAARMGDLLGLAAPAAPWHARRDNIAGLAAAVGIAIGSLGKMARDISLLAQNGVGEAREPPVEGRGGSSAMPHKRNPTGCQIALSAALRAPGLVASILSGMMQELERGLGGWQAEAPVLAELFMLAGGSAEAMAAVAEGLEIDEEELASNLARAGLGDDEGEAEAITLSLLEQYRREH